MYLRIFDYNQMCLQMDYLLLDLKQYFHYYLS